MTGVPVPDGRKEDGTTQGAVPLGRPVAKLYTASIGAPTRFNDAGDGVGRWTQ